jgi:hypothetical protein
MVSESLNVGQIGQSESIRAAPLTIPRCVLKAKEGINLEKSSPAYSFGKHLALQHRKTAPRGTVLSALRPKLNSRLNHPCDLDFWSRQILGASPSPQLCAAKVGVGEPIGNRRYLKL